MTLVREHILDGTAADVIERYESLGNVAQQSDFGILDTNVVVIDTETTGLSFHHDELIQIAAARLERGEIVDWYVTFVDPGRFLTEDIKHLTGITEQDLVGAPSPEEALEGLVQFAGDALMVAHNANFDKTFVTRHPAGYPLLQNTWIDSLELSRIALPRLKSHRLIDLVRTFDAPVSTHRADDDVAATCVVYRILLAGVAAIPYTLVKAISQLAPQEEWETGYVFKEMARFMNPDENERGREPGVTPAEDALASPESRASTAQKPRKWVFSLNSVRAKRIQELPERRSRNDADELVGQLKFPTEEDIRAAFSKEGLLGRIYSDYEQREEQVAMALAVRDAFEKHESLVVEAGTGVGKSMAYLLVAALFAQLNQITIGVATKTNALLDQLTFQELPALAQALDQQTSQLNQPNESPGQPDQLEQPNQPNQSPNQPLRWAPIKGMNHYLCLRKVDRLVSEGPQLREVQGRLASQAPALAAVLSFIEQSEFDDIDGLKIDYRLLPRYLITSTSSECLRNKCPFFRKLCFARGARRRAESADIMLTNHTLLFCDVAADGGLLPVTRHWVIDEAHSVENEARQAFALTVDSEQVNHLISRVSEQAGSRNIFTRTERALSSNDESQMTLFLGLLAKAQASARAFESAGTAYIAGVKKLLYFDEQGKSKRNQSYETVDVWINDQLRESTIFTDLMLLAGEMVETADKLILNEQELVGYLEDYPSAAVVQREIATHALELKELRQAAELIFGQPGQPANPLYVYQATLFRKKDRFSDRLQALLLDVGQKMDEDFYARLQSVIYASATMAIGESFEVFEQAVGLNTSEFSQAAELKLNSSYDFDNNMIVYVVKDMPEPNESGYLDALVKLLVAAHRANDGSMLTLFTNRREMEHVYDQVSEQLMPDNLRVVCQKWGVSPKSLRDEFVQNERLSLFALKSFWEGFDAPGSTLRGVVITKLPFSRPTDPLYCERANRDDRAWWHYVLPQAVIETKQAAGRLIRRADDKGVLILADKRLISKKYGSQFLSSLQSKTVRVCTLDEIVAQIESMEL